MKLATYSYSLFRFVPDIARGEAANLGVIVVDDEARAVGSAFLPDSRGKVSALAPSSKPDVIADAIDEFRRCVTDVHQGGSACSEDVRIRSSEQLRVLASAMRNQLQLSEPRLCRAASLDDAVRQLYRELVE